MYPITSPLDNTSSLYIRKFHSIWPCIAPVISHYYILINNYTLESQFYIVNNLPHVKLSRMRLTTNVNGNNHNHNDDKENPTEYSNNNNRCVWWSGCRNCCNFENREFQTNLYHAIKCVIKVIIIQFLLRYYYTVA